MLNRGLILLGILISASAAFAVPYVWPISGTTVPDPMHTSYGPRMDYSKWQFHDGMDLPAAQGTSVVAVADGQIILANVAGTDSYSSRHVLLKILDISGDTLYASYMHLDWLQAGLFVGQIVTQGQILAGVGHDDASYDHLHFEIRRNSVFGVASTHPLHYLPYPDTANFVSAYASTFNVMSGAMAARLVFSAPDRDEGDLAIVEVDVKQGTTVLQTRVVNVDDRTTVQQGAVDSAEWTNDIALEGYQWSDMTLQNWPDLQYGVLLRNLPAAADNLVARVVDIGGNTSVSGSFAIPAQIPVSWYDDYNGGTWDPGWSAVTSATGSGTSITISSAAALEGAQGLLCQDSSNSEFAPQLATLQRAIPTGRFEWVAQAEVNPAMLNLGGAFQDAFPISIFNSTGLSAAAIIRDNGTFYQAAVLMRNPDNSYGGTLSGVTITAGLPMRWTWHLTHLATRYSTAILYLNGAEVTRWFWDSLAQPMEDLRMGLGFSSTGARATLHEDATWFKEDTASFFAGTATPTLSATPSATASPTGTVTPPAAMSFTSTPTATPSASSSATPTGTLTQTISLSSTISPTFSATVTGIPSSGKLQSVSGDEAPEIISVAVLPNPLSSPSGLLMVNLSGNTQRFQWTLFSTGFTRIAFQSFETPAGPGMNYLPVDSSDWPKGLLYLQVTVEGHGKKSVKTAKVFVLR